MRSRRSGSTTIQMPMTPERVWRAMHAAEGSVSHVFRRLRLPPRRARSPEAQQLLAAHPGAKLLAGGHSLIPLLKLRLAHAGRAHRHRPHRRAAGHRRRATASLRIGALTTHAELAASADVRRSAAGAGGGGGARRRSGGAQPRHDRRQHRARGSRVGSADRARRARRAHRRRRPARRADDRRGTASSPGIMATALADDEDPAARSWCPAAGAARARRT